MYQFMHSAALALLLHAIMDEIRICTSESSHMSVKIANILYRVLLYVHLFFSLSTGI